MDLMRNKGRMTRLLILLRVVLDAPKDQKDLAGPVGMTPQAVSLYLKRMAREGLIIRDPKGPRATVEGVELLHRELLALKGFVDSSIMGLDIVRSTDAVAKGDLRRGERCTLFMEDGLLFARKGGSGPSMGTAEADAGDGSMVPVSGLSGVMDLRPGALQLIKVTPARSGGGSLRLDPNKMPWGVSGHRTAALDMEALALLRRSGIRCDSELPLPEDIRAMLLRGLDVAAVGTPHAISLLRSGLGGFPPQVEELEPGPGTKWPATRRKKG